MPGHRAGLPWRVATYNVLSLKATGRLQEIVHRIDADVLCLQGLQWRCDKFRRYHIFEFEQANKHWTAIISGFDSKQVGSNKSAGVAVILGERARALRLAEVALPPVTVQGRGLLVRLKAAMMDFTVSTCIHHHLATIKQLHHHYVGNGHLSESHAKWQTGLSKTCGIHQIVLYLFS